VEDNPTDGSSGVDLLSIKRYKNCGHSLFVNMLRTTLSTIEILDVTVLAHSVNRYRNGVSEKKAGHGILAEGKFL
jgi:hypothetical protein